MVSYFTFNIFITSLLIAAISLTVAEKCVPVDKDSESGAVVMDTCPKDYNGDDLVVKNCGNSNDLSDPLMADLVTDASTKTTYQNSHCAACNNAPMEDLIFWNILLDCKSHHPLDVKSEPIEENLKYMKGANKWGLVNHHKIRKCDLTFVKPDYLNVEDCNAKSEARRETGFMGDFFSKDKAASNTTRKPAKFFNFAMLLDVNSSGGDSVGEENRQNKCEKDEKWDPFFKSCRKLVCAIPGFELVDGKCKKKE